MNAKQILRILPLVMIFVLVMFQWSCKKNSSTDNSTSQITYGTMTDIDGNVYKTIKIGNQTWMAENLKTTKFRNGAAILNVSDSAQWSTDLMPAYCIFNNDPANTGVYGLLYNGYAAIDGNNIAPAGWHVPADSEWVTLNTFLGTGAGGKLKATGTTYWNSPNTGATNETGFNALGGGNRGAYGQFHNQGVYCFWWAATTTSSTDAYNWVVAYNYNGLYQHSYPMTCGFNIRCVKDN